MKKLLLILVIALFLLPSCSLSAQERDYINDYNYYQDMTLDAVNNLLPLITAWEPDNEAWCNNVFIQLAIIRVGYNHVKGISPPISMTQIHIKYLRAMSEFDSLREPIMTGIAYKDENPPRQVIISLDIGMQYLAETQALIDNF